MKNIYCLFVLFILLLYGNINAQGWVQYGTGGQLASFWALSAVNDSVCWFAGKPLTVIAKIQSSGSTYTWCENGLLNSDGYSAICGRSSTLAYTGSNNGKIYKTTDGGTSWIKQFTQSGGASYIDGIYFWTDNLGIAFGDPVAYPGTGPFTVLRTTDGGTNWNDISATVPTVTAQFGYNQAFDAVGTHFWFPSVTGSADTTVSRYLFHSRDNGLTWEKLTIPLNFGDFRVAFSDTSNGILTNNYSKIARTTDGGKTWSVKYNGVGYQPLAILKGTNKVWVQGYYDSQAGNNPIYFSNDFGLTWGKQPRNSPVTISGIAPVSQNVVWASGFNDLILHNSNASVATSISTESIKPPVPSSFELSQNYPNPFNPTTTIKYHVEKLGNTKLVVYDLMGRDIRTLVNDNQTAGWHLVVWDGTNDSRQPVATGPYFYRIEGNGQSMTKKMILLK